LFELVEKRLYIVTGTVILNSDTGKFVNNKTRQAWIDSSVIRRRAQVYFDVTRMIKSILGVRIFYCYFIIRYQFECYYFVVDF